jgi:hypothetical protein
MKSTIQGADWRPDPQNPDGPSIETVEVLQAFSVEELEDLCSRYDSSSGTSPPLRATLDAYLAWKSA